jgi:hypothetical protein
MPPYLTCDPQAGVRAYELTVDAKPFISILAESNGSIHYDIGYLPVGEHLCELRGGKPYQLSGDEQEAMNWSQAVHFQLTSPGLPLPPSGLGLSNS